MLLVLPDEGLCYKTVETNTKLCLGCERMETQNNTRYFVYV